MRLTTASLLIFGFLFSCATENQKSVSEKIPFPISGTWQLLSVETIQGADTTLDLYTHGIKGIKMFNESHFSFFQHDLQGGKEGDALFVSGGGTYTLVDGSYSEYLEFCNYREYEDHSFNFQVSISGDTLIQKGKEEVEEIGVDKYIIETYLRVGS